MADYTIRNLKQVQDLAPRFGLAPSIEARFATEALGCKKTGVSYQRFAPGFRAPFGHRQRKQEELYVLVSGSAWMKLDEELVHLEQWDAVRVDPSIVRAFEAGPEGVEMLVFGAPRTGPGDAEMKPDAWLG